MKYEGEFLPTIVRLSNFIKRQYDCSFDYHDIENFSLAEDPVIREKLKADSYVVGADWVYHSVLHQDQVVGVACVSRPEKFTDNDLKAVNTIIRTVFECRIESLQAIRKLEFIEDNLESLNTQALDPKAISNVIALQKFKKNEFPLPDKSIQTAFNFPFLIEAKNTEDIFKMALEVHSRSQRFAFLSLSDLDPSSIETVQGMRALGEITIYVQDITQLSHEQQSYICAYYMSSRDKMGPQFIVGSAYSIAELHASRKVLPELLSHLTIGYLRLTKPFKAYKDRDILEFFFDSLAGRTYHE
jgi:hypothetical protein